MPSQAHFALVFCAFASACMPAAQADAPNPTRAPWARYDPDSTPPGSRGPRDLGDNPLPSRPHDFQTAKHRLYGDVYTAPEVRTEIYCGCNFSADHAIDARACGYTPTTRDPERAHRVEWDHGMPFSRFGRLFACYRDHERGGRSAREHCTRTDTDARDLEGDMHNLLPALGEINALRRDYDLDEVAGENHIGGCDFEVSPGTRTAEPRPEARGDLARAYLYMHLTYRIPLTDAERARYLAWHQADPPTAWERTRNERIRALQGNDNPFVSNPTLGL